MKGEKLMEKSINNVASISSINRVMAIVSYALIIILLNITLNYSKCYAYYFYDNNANWTGSYHEYNDDVEVITAVEVFATDGFPRQNKRPHERKDDAAKSGAVNKTGECKVTFSGACGTKTQQGAIAKGESRLFWVKWRTPKIDTLFTENTVTINVNVPTGAYIIMDGSQVTSATITCKIYNPWYDIPPDTNYDDEDEGYITSCPIDRMPDQLEQTWYTYTYKWVEDWHYVCTRSGNDESGYPEDYGNDPHGKDDVTCMMHECPDSDDHECPTGDCSLDKQDWGEVVWEKWEYKAILQLTSQKLQLADNTPFPEHYPQDFDYDRIETVRSGYGLWYRFNCSSMWSQTGNGNPEAIQYNETDYFTHPQVTMYYYPEFSYDTYADRGINMDVDNESYTPHQGMLNFHTMANDTPPNPYSHFNEMCHYIPIWYPDGEYEVLAEVSSCFCAGGELTLSGSQHVIIEGSLWDDLHIRQKNKLK